MSTALTTPDGRYLVVNARLWRAANPQLPAQARVRYTRELMAARRAVRAAKDGGDEAALRAAHVAVNAAKRRLGERGPVWWDDGAPDYHRMLARNTPYADWYAGVQQALAAAGPAGPAVERAALPPGFLPLHSPATAGRAAL